MKKDLEYFKFLNLLDDNEFNYYIQPNGMIVIAFNEFKLIVTYDNRGFSIRKNDEKRAKYANNANAVFRLIMKKYLSNNDAENLDLKEFEKLMDLIEQDSTMKITSTIQNDHVMQLVVRTNKHFIVVSRENEKQFFLSPYKEPSVKSRGARGAEHAYRLLKQVYSLPENDPINHPGHYNHGDIETIDVIKSVLTPEEFRGYLKGNMLKYRERHPYKGNPEQDLAKAKWYSDRLKLEERRLNEEM